MGAVPIRRSRAALAALAIVLTSVWPTNAPAVAGTLDVCASGCAYTTIQAAIDAASPGDTITVAAGTYVEDLDIDVAVTLEGPNAGVAAGPGPTLPSRGAEAVIRGVTAAGAGVSVDGVVVDGFTFVRPDGSAATVDVRLISNAVAGIRSTVRNSILDLGVYAGGVLSERGCGSAFSSTQSRAGLSTTVTFEYNTVRNQIYRSSAPACSNLYASRSIYLDGAGTDALVRGNLFVDASMAVYATGAAHRTRVIGNRFQSGGQGPTFGAIEDAQIKDNVFVNTQGYAVYLDHSVRTVIQGNTFLDINASYPYLSLSQTTGVSILGNTFAPTSLNTAAYWSILIGGAVWNGSSYVLPTTPDTGTTIANNRFGATTSSALWNCTAEGTTFTENLVGSPGRLVSGVSYAVRNGHSSATSCSGKSLDASGNAWSGGAGGILTNAPATTTRTSDLETYTEAPLTPGFWPLPPAAETITETLAPTPDAPKIVARYDAPGGAPDLTVAIDFGAISATGDVEVTPSSTTTDGSVSFGGNPIIDITFDGTFTPPVEICLSYDDASFPPGTTPALWHYSGGAWSRLETSRLDLTNKVVCGLAESFSGFGVGVANVAPVVTGVTASPESQLFGGDVVVSADATDADGTVAAVEYSLDDGATWTAMSAGTGTSYSATITRPAAGSYTVTVRARDDLGANSAAGTTDTFEILRPRDPAPLLYYSGESATADGTVELAAIIMPARCMGSVVFDVTPDPVGGDPDPVTVDGGSASAVVTLPAWGLYEVTATWDGTGSTCAIDEVEDRATVVSYTSGGSGRGSGSYLTTTEETGPTRASFSFDVRETFTGRGRNAVWTGYAGRLTWTVDRAWRIQGSFAGGRETFGLFTCPTEMDGLSPTARCGAFTGSGLLQQWDPDLRGPGKGGWLPGVPTTFTVSVFDGDPAGRCRRNCPADWFGIEIDDLEDVAVPQTAPVRLALPGGQGSIILSV